jgi:ribosome-binding factor A
MTRRYSKEPSQRQLRVSELIRSIISDALAKGDVYHPGFDGVMITIQEVRISPDLKVATAFVSITPDDHSQERIKLLGEHTPEFRKILSSQMQGKYIPELRFIFDEAGSNASRIDQLLAETRRD